MSMLLDEPTRRKLVLVKQLYSHGVVLAAERHGFFSRTLAVISFDLAIETVLRLVISSLDPSVSLGDERTFPKLVQQTNDKLKESDFGSFPGEGNVKHVHHVRNDAQHGNRYPSQIEINDCRTYARDFLKSFCRLVWAINFETLSLANAVKHSRAREFLVEAENQLSSGKYQQAVNSAAAGLRLALKLSEGGVLGKMPSFSGGIVLYDSFGKPMSETDGRIALHSLERMREALLIITLGLDYGDFIQYKSLIPVVVFKADGTVVFNGHNAARDFSHDEAEFVVTYCIDSVVKIEDKAGDLGNQPSHTM